MESIRIQFVLQSLFRQEVGIGDRLKSERGSKIDSRSQNAPNLAEDPPGDQHGMIEWANTRRKFIGWPRAVLTPEGSGSCQVDSRQPAEGPERGSVRRMAVSMPEAPCIKSATPTGRESKSVRYESTKGSHTFHASHCVSRPRSDARFEDSIRSAAFRVPDLHAWHGRPRSKPWLARNATQIRDVLRLGRRARQAAP